MTHLCLARGAIDWARVFNALAASAAARRDKNPVLAALLPGVVNNPPLTAAVPTGRILFLLNRK
jgi:hypothetical protein